MTLAKKIEKANADLMLALASIRDARDASQLQLGGANFSKTTRGLNLMADEVANLRYNLALTITDNERRERNK